MAASITAGPNPVGFWSPSDTGTTTISWNTDAGNGVVTLSIDGGAETTFDDPGKNKNTKSLSTVKLGHTYVLTLRLKSNNKFLDAVTVTTEDLEQWLVDHTVDWGTRELGMSPPAQVITDLTVVPGVDTVRISFRTAQPTIPSVTVQTEDGTQVAGWLPLLGGMRTQHECLLGQNSPLAQETLHRSRIVANGTTFLGKPHESVVTGSFVTGSRKVTLFFDRINVRKDGDTGLKGAGEFTFVFQAGDADLGKPAVAQFQELWGEGDVSDDDPPIDVNRMITIPHAPRRIWAQVVGDESDFSSPWGSGARAVPWFDGEGTWPEESSRLDRAWVAKVFQLDELWIARIDDVLGYTPFELATGDFGVAFTVYGRLQVDARSGTTLSVRKVKRARHARPSTHAAVTAPGTFGVVGVGEGHALAAGVGADGAIYSKALGAGEQMPRDQGWAKLADGVTGPVTILATENDRLELFALGADGTLAAWTLDQGRSSGRWRRLGGRFVEPVVAVAGKDGRTELLGLDEERVVFHRSLMPDDRNIEPEGWTRIGGGVGGSLQAFASGHGGLAVFALGQDGTVLHKRRGAKRWQPAGTEWQSLGRTSGVRLLAEQFDDEGVGLATIADDGSLQVLLWRDYPTGVPGGWKAHGTLESSLDATGEAQSPPRKAWKPRRTASRADTTEVSA